MLFKKCYLNFRNIHRKTPLLKPLFNKVAGLKTVTPTKVFSCEYYEILKNTYQRLILHLVHAQRFLQLLQHWKSLQHWYLLPEHLNTSPVRFANDEFVKILFKFRGRCFAWINLMLLYIKICSHPLFSGPGVWFSVPGKVQLFSEIFSNNSWWLGYLSTYFPFYNWSETAGFAQLPSWLRRL